MALDQGSEEEVERAMALYKKLYKTRRRPLKSKGKGADELWGELRSLCQGEMTGGEVWIAWRPFFKAFPEDQREALCHYVQEAWGYPVRDFGDVEQAFVWHVLCTNIKAMQAAGFEVMNPPLGEERMLAYEAAHAINVPEPWRSLLVHVTSGKTIDYETILFDFDALEESPDSLVFGTFLERRIAEDLSNGMDYWSKKTWIFERLAGALAYFASHPRLKMCSAEQSKGDGAAFMQDARSALIMGGYFEGNHGDSTYLMITQGPLCGAMIDYASLEHAGPDGAHISFGRLHLATWLREMYHIHCLGEEIWDELPLGIDY